MGRWPGLELSEGTNSLVDNEINRNETWRVSVFEKFASRENQQSRSSHGNKFVWIDVLRKNQHPGKLWPSDKGVIAAVTSAAFA